MQLALSFNEISFPNDRYEVDISIDSEIVVYERGPFVCTV